MATDITPQFNRIVNGPADTQADKDKQEIVRLRSTCLTYDELKPKWDLYLSAYVGGDAVANSTNLHKHPREHNDDYKGRVERLHYLNYCEPLVDFFTAFIFAETIQRNGGGSAAFYDDFITDVNKKGDDVTAFMQQVSDEKQIFGVVYVLVDAPVKGDRMTKAQEQKAGIRPYWVLIRPTEILDWVVDPFDKLLYLKRQQFVEDYEGGTHRVFERYTEWTRDIVKVTDIDVTDTKMIRLLPPTTFDNSLGQVPIVPFRYRKSKTYSFIGDSFLTDLAPNNVEVMNLTSLLQEFLYRQCFNILAVQTDPQIPTKEQQEGEIGTANLMEYPKGAEAPQYIAPDSAPAKFIQEERQRLINEMYKRAAQDTVNELFNGTKSSGFSKAQTFSTTVPKIATRADVLEKGENKLMELTMRYMNKKWDGKIKYKDRYELTNITDAITQLSMLFRDLQMPSETFAKQEFKRLVHEFDGKIPKEDMAKIEAEIDKLDFAAFMETQKLALIGNAGNSPADQQKPKDTNTMSEHQSESRSATTAATKKVKR